MNEKTLQLLEYTRVKEQLAQYALSYLGKQYIDALQPETDERRVVQLLQESVEAKAITAQSGSVPIPALEGLPRVVSMLDKNFVFTEADFTSIAQFILSSHQLQQYLRRKQEIAPRVSGYVESLQSLDPLLDEIERCISYGELTDSASAGLSKIRKKIAVLEARLRRKLDTTLTKYQRYLQESIVMHRNGQSVLAVKRDYKRFVPGRLIDESSSGQTVFIQPEDTSVLQQDLDFCRSQEEDEKYKILCWLSEVVDQNQVAIRTNLEVVGYLDFVIAKGKYANAISASSVALNHDGVTVIKQGRHPLLKMNCVPVDFAIGDSYQALIITGPNTGGKTVTLKIVGLLTLMVQSGLLVPVQPGSQFAVYNNILADIGDGQSLDQSLSTFSAHIQNIVDVLRFADAKTLVLLDELATGTDPGEGVGLSIAVLEQLYQRGATVVATTHFNEIKQFASVTPGFENARMEFNLDTLQPLYHLTIGEAGRSYALQIAQKLGLSGPIIQRARELSRDSSNEAAADLPLVSKSRNKPRPEQPARSKPKSAAPRPPKYEIGDRVWVHARKCSAIVFSLPDEKGNLVILIKKQKNVINQKRISPYLSRKDLYPDDYDLDIVLESKEVRKKRKLMTKKHVDGLTIDYPDPPQT